MYASAILQDCGRGLSGKAALQLVFGEFPGATTAIRTAPVPVTYLARAVQSAGSGEEAADEADRRRDKLSEEEAAEIGRIETEKAIEEV